MTRHLEASEPEAALAPCRQTDTAVPLVVDLDGTLLHGDLLHESTLALLKPPLPHIVNIPLWLLRGKAHMKREIASRVDLDVTAMPYNAALIDWLRGQKATGRRIVLATASDMKLAAAVARHLGLFDEVLASDGRVNNSAHRKADALAARYGERGFDYVGNSRADLPVWKRARRAILVGAPDSIRRAADRIAVVEREFDGPRTGAKTWFRALRLHQWAKNLLLFLPLLGAHRIFEPALFGTAVLAFVAFSLCASSVYLINDLMDLESDRHHPRKRQRPFASGQLMPLTGAVAAIALLVASGAIALAVGFAFASWLAVYFTLTIAYTFWLKRKEIVDALALAALYTLRVIAGGAAVGVAASFWLLAFSMFLFLSLAFVKRVSELQLVVDQGRGETKGRGYMASDLPLIEAMGIVSGFVAVLVLALYLNSQTVVLLYSRPEVMWLTVPILLYWVTRVWIKTHRGLMHDDPVLFAVRDKVSLLSGGMFLLVLWLAAS